MKRKQFLSSLVTLPSLLFGPQKSKLLDPVVVCVGYLGRTVWHHLIINHTHKHFYLTMANTGDLAACIQHFHRHRKVILVAQLDDFHLLRTLDLLLLFEKGYGDNIVGLFAYPENPTSQQVERTEEALRKLPQIIGGFRMIKNTCDSKWFTDLPLEFRGKISDAGKTIVWEILKNYG